MYDWIVPEAEVIVQDPIQDTRRFVKDSGKAAEVSFQVEVTKSHRFSIVKMSMKRSYCWWVVLWATSGGVGRGGSDSID